MLHYFIIDESRDNQVQASYLKTLEHLLKNNNVSFSLFITSFNSPDYSNCKKYYLSLQKKFPRRFNVYEIKQETNLLKLLKIAAKKFAPDKIIFINFSKTFFYSFLSVFQKTPHIVYDVHMLANIPGFIKENRIDSKIFARLLAHKKNLLKIYYIFPAFEYLYLNYGFPGSVLSSVRYALDDCLFKPYRQKNQEKNYIFAAGNHARDYKSFVKALAKTPFTGIIRTTNKKLLKNLPRIKNITYHATGLSLEKFIEETAKAQIIALPLKNIPGCTCGLSFLAIALMLGKPIITTACPSTEGYIKDGENGFLVSPGDHKALRQKIEILAKNADLRQKFSRASLKFAKEKMDMTKLFKNMLDIGG